MWIALKTAEQVICMLNKKGDTVHVQQGWIKKVTALDASQLVVSGSGKKSHKYLAQGKVQFVYSLLQIKTFGYTWMHKYHLSCRLWTSLLEEKTVTW